MALRILFKKDGFTLAEIIVSALVAVLILLAAWAIYVLGWTWWYEVSPRIEAQRIARLSLDKVIEGVPDPTAGEDIIGSGRYKKRNGISGTYYFRPEIPNINQIDYGLYEDYKAYQPAVSRNVRSFYLVTDADTGVKAVYYKDGNGAAHKINSTQGISDLKFNYYVDNGGFTYYDIIAVTATVEKDVSGIGHNPYHIKAEYTDYVNLRNYQ